jgi:hypothetical protein
MRVHKTNKESIYKLRQPAKVFTAEGMSEVKRTMGTAAVMTSTQKLGSDGLWYRDAARYIQSRPQYDLEQLKVEGFDQQRASRHIPLIFAKALPYVAPMIWDAVKAMFVSDGTILESLATIQSAIPKQFKGFTDIPIIVPEVVALLRLKMGNTDQYEYQQNRPSTELKPSTRGISRYNRKADFLHLWLFFRKYIHTGMVLKSDVNGTPRKKYSLTNSISSSSQNTLGVTFLGFLYLILDIGKQTDDVL